MSDLSSIPDSQSGCPDSIAARPPPSTDLPTVKSRFTRQRMTATAMMDIDDMLDSLLNPPIPPDIAPAPPSYTAAPAPPAYSGTEAALSVACAPLLLDSTAAASTSREFASEIPTRVKTRRGKARYAQPPWNDMTIPTMVLRPGRIPGHRERSLEEFFVPVWLAARSSAVWDRLLHEEPKSCPIYDNPAQATRKESKTAYANCLCHAHNSYQGRRVVVIENCLAGHIRQVLEICRAAAANEPVAFPTPDDDTLLTLGHIASKCALTPVVNYVAKTVPVLAARDPLGWFVRCYVCGWHTLLPVCARLSFSPRAAQDSWAPIAGIDDSSPDVILARKAFADLGAMYREALSDSLQGQIVGDGGDGFDCAIPALDGSHIALAFFICTHYPDAELLLARLGDATVVTVNIAFVDTLRDLQQQLVVYPSERTLVTFTRLRDYAGTVCSKCRDEMRVDVNDLAGIFAKLLERSFAHSSVPFPDIQACVVQQHKDKRIDLNT
ncbi:hypothetical protein PsYK624_170070 [Phanerochaete sordida]|uniref:Uncharacterized protein n=1 Tax=Phanerochaete sordida TaxID=48140 RepID=A0A9P3LMD1_9APHY|nr:hypothetical protein PsYK624_170070 [Phanerochaete sordida]